MKPLQFLSFFLAGVAAVTLGGWGLSLTPDFLVSAATLGGLVFLLFLALLLLDDWIANAINMEMGTYYGAVWFSFVVVVSGCILAWGTIVR